METVEELTLRERIVEFIKVNRAHKDDPVGADRIIMGLGVPEADVLEELAQMAREGAAQYKTVPGGFKPVPGCPDT